MRDLLYLAPLQSYTDFHFRNAFQQVLGDVDRFYAPYLKMNHAGELKAGPKLDVLPTNNPFEKVIPQIMASNARDFLVMTNYLESLGYTEANWNLGCPYPMVAKRDLGAGILNKPDKVYAILEDVLPKTSLNIGIKMRMGYESTRDSLALVPRLNDFPLTELIIHARFGKQLYQGACDENRFSEIIPLTKHTLVYNGDLNSVADFRRLKVLFPTIQHWMIGRGAISNPFIFEMIQEDATEFPEDRNEIFYEFILLLQESLLHHTQNASQTLIRLIHYWEYFAGSFEDGHLFYRKVKKLKKLEEYEDLLNQFLVR